MTEQPQSNPTGSEPPAPTPALAEEDVKQIEVGAPAVQAALDAEPTLQAEIEQVVQDRLRQPVTGNSLEDMVQALQPALDDATARYFLTALFTRSELYLDAVKTHTDTATWGWLRRLRMLYGANLQEAYYLWSEYEHSWRTLNFRMLYDRIYGRSTLTVDILKVNRERYFLEMAPDNALAFVNAFLTTLNTLSAEEVPKLLASDTVQTLKDQVGILLEMYEPSAEDEDTPPPGNGAAPPDSL